LVAGQSVGELIDFSGIFWGRRRGVVVSCAWRLHVTAVRKTIRWSKFISDVLRGGMGARAGFPGIPRSFISASVSISSTTL